MKNIFGPSEDKEESEDSIYPNKIRLRNDLPTMI